jgi:hypothetical protein
MSWLNGVVLRLLVGKAEGALAEHEGWRTKLGAALTILTSAAAVLAAAICIGQALLSGKSTGDITTDVHGCLSALALGTGGAGVGIAALGLRRALARQEERTAAMHTANLARLTELAAQADARK